jgi:hypothetical protein
MAVPFRLVTVVLVALSLLLSIVATATTRWIVGTVGGYDGSNYYVGLFSMCQSQKGGSCESTVDAFHLLMEGAHIPSSCISRLRAAQAFVVIGILTLFPLLLLVISRHLLPSGTIALRVWHSLDVVLAASVALCLTISWGVVAGFHNDCVCEASGTNLQPCGLNYSFALAVAAWVAALGAAVVSVLASKTVSAGYTGMDASLEQ